MDILISLACITIIVAGGLYISIVIYLAPLLIAQKAVMGEFISIFRD